jgi:prepilin-type N-terminal cleavage/methylation domain-containing protein
MATKSAIHGFTLIELAIVLFIITLLLGGVLTPLGQQIAERQTGESRRAMESARLALVGYALRQADQAGPLPCPDVRAASTGDADNHASDGLEDRLADGKCAASTGNLPWKTLGLAEGDAWGNHLGYAVAASWANAASGVSVASTGATDLLQICPDKSCAQPMPAAAVVFSHGRNGFGANNLNDSRNLAPTSADEIENNNDDHRFVMHPPRATDRPGGEFDDLLLPISADWLRGRLCEPASLCAGR